MSRTTIGAAPTRADLLLEVDALKLAGKRHDLDAIHKHHDYIVELVDKLLPVRRLCPECEIGGGLHVEGCPHGGSP